MIVAEDFTRGVGAILEASEDVIYMGYPGPGTNSTTQAKWRIKKIETIILDGKSKTLIKWADGNLEFDHIFDDCELLTYSFLK
jgi:hypothetical protein